MKELTYTCRFCKITRTFETDPKPLTELGINVKIWLENLCCDRCSQYNVTKQKIGERIARACKILIQARSQQAARLGEIEASVKNALVRLTENFCKTICDYHHKQTVIDSEFAAMLFQKPEKFNQILNHYQKAIPTIQ